MHAFLQKNILLPGFCEHRFVLKKIASVEIGHVLPRFSLLDTKLGSKRKVTPKYAPCMHELIRNPTDNTGAQYVSKL